MKAMPKPGSQSFGWLLDFLPPPFSASAAGAPAKT
jgi:hypothetical protein